MLARPEPGTREHILLWLSSQPADRPYNWVHPNFCACGTYAREAMGKSNLWAAVHMSGNHTPFSQLNLLAHDCQPRTYGALYELARQAWS